MLLMSQAECLVGHRSASGEGVVKAVSGYTVSSKCLLCVDRKVKVFPVGLGVAYTFSLHR